MCKPHCLKTWAYMCSICVHAKSLQSCPTLCDPVECNPPGSSVHGILQARILEWVAMPFSRGSSQPRSPTLQADSLPFELPGKPKYLLCVHTQACLALYDIMGCSQPSFSVHGILQAKILMWVAISFSKGSSQPRGPTGISWDS